MEGPCLKLEYRMSPYLAGKHDDVEQVQDGAEYAHNQAEVAVDAPVSCRELVQVAAHPAQEIDVFVQGVSYASGGCCWHLISSIPIAK